MEVKLIGEVYKYIYENSDNNYRIFLLADKARNYYTLSGYIPRLSEELTYEFITEEVKHSKYGLQYKIISYENVVDTSKEGVVVGKSIIVYPMFGDAYSVEIEEGIGGHGGGDTRMLDEIFANPDILETL